MYLVQFVKREGRREDARVPISPSTKKINIQQLIDDNAYTTTKERINK